MTSTALRAAILAATLLLSGCAGAEAPAYAPDAATSLQTQVLAVSDAAAGGDLDGALTRLNELEAMANDALADEKITPERHTAIVAAIALVRGDVQAAIAVRDAPPPAPSESTSNEDKGKGDENGKGDGKGNDD